MSEWRWGMAGFSVSFVLIPHRESLGIITYFRSSEQRDSFS